MPVAAGPMEVERQRPLAEDHEAAYRPLHHAVGPHRYGDASEAETAGAVGDGVVVDHQVPYRYEVVPFLQGCIADDANLLRGPHDVAEIEEAAALQGQGAQAIILGDHRLASLLHYGHDVYEEPFGDGEDAYGNLRPHL